jgi:hypothetical protein
MATQIAIAVAVAAIAVGVAWVLQRKRATQAPTQGGWAVPRQLDRADFARPEAPWLVVVFSSSTCHSCEDMVRKARVLESPAVAVQDVEATAQAGLHKRYRIDAVPISVVADSFGVVRAAFVGPASATDLWAALAEVRQPGSSPEPNLGRDHS